MKLSDFVAFFLANKGVKHVFAVSGGASLHLIHSIAETENIDFVCPQHEQAAAMAADSYSRVTGRFGAAVATSGPGATNLITGICGAYYDSVPVMYITGQVATHRMKGDTGVRQIGFQETEIVDMCKSITNYAVRINNPNDIKYELEKSYYLSKAGRPGPVLIDIPDDLQREEIIPENLRSYVEEKRKTKLKISNKKLADCHSLIRDAERPIIILGWGIHLAQGYKELDKFLLKFPIPVVSTWALAHAIPSNHPMWVGTFGTHGTRYANFAVQNSDLIISIGSRLDTKATGSPTKTFAREAKKIMVDIDPHELNKFKRHDLNFDHLIHSDVKEFLGSMVEKTGELNLSRIPDWLKTIDLWKKRYPICPESYYKEVAVNPYVFVKALAKESKEKDVICLDTGCAVAWMLQAFEFKKDQRLYHDFNNTAMGWALPACIGASFALDKKTITCVVGDGSLLMNLQELATIAKHNLPIRIYLLNNNGYSMVQQTQDQWLDSKYYGTSEKGGLVAPDFKKIAEAHGIKCLSVTRNDQISKTIKIMNAYDGPIFCNIILKPEHRVIPQVKYGAPNEDMEPLLSRKEFLGNMVVKPLE